MTIKELDDKLNSPGFQDTENGDLFYNLYASDIDAWNTFSLPRTGKDIVVTTWYQDGRKKQKTAKWTGTYFDM